MRLTRLTQEWIRHLSVAQNAPANTVRGYGRDVSEFVSYLGSAATVQDITVQAIRGFLAGFYGIWAPSTVGRKLSALRAFCCWLRRRGELADDPAQHVAMPKRRSGLPATATPQAAGELVEAPDRSNSAGLRDRALLELLYGGGLRRSEVVILDLGAVDGDWLRVPVGHKRDERLVPLGTAAAEALAEYLASGRPALKHPRTGTQDPVALFLNCRGSRLTARSVNRVVSRYEPPAGISPKVLRHSYAVHMIDSGADLRTLQVLFGHRHLSTTVRYEGASLVRVRSEYMKAHPRARTKGATQCS